MVETTLLTVRNPLPPAPSREPDKGNQWVGLEIKQCIVSNPVESSPADSTYQGDFYLATPSGEQIQGEGSSWSNWPKPKFPEMVTMTTPGECLSGWIAIQAPQGVTITKIIWRPSGQTVAEWLP